MSREQFPVNHPEAWPTELREQLEKDRKLFLNWENSPGSVGAPACDNAMYALRNMLDSYALTGWHCTRLTDAEIRHIKHRGMQLPDDAMLGRRIAMLEGACEIPRDIAQRLVARNQADDSNRVSKLWFCFFPPHLAGESAVSRFFRNWGGEALYNSHERDPETSPIIRRIGTPCIVEADVPTASASSRFNYDYNEEEPCGLATQILEISKSVERTHVVFNNNFEDQEQSNARTLMQIPGQGAVAP